VSQNAGAPTPAGVVDAILPVIVLIALTNTLFGVSATDGPLQVPLLLSAAFASLVLKNGFLSPILDVVYGFIGFKVPGSAPTAPDLGDHRRSDGTPVTATSAPD
jgi:hypothetical protein